MLLLGLSGSIAAYKTCELASTLQQKGVEIQTIMTESATAFVGTLTFEALTGRKVLTDKNYFDNSMAHIKVTDDAKLFLIAPATANTLAQLAQGLAGDLLTTTALSVDSPLWIAPAMNTRMWEHPATQENIAKLKSRDKVRFFEPDSGSLACGHNGKGRMASPQVLADAVLEFFNK
jgi:phosphopantothenoylcysteine decarboxylase/phosphopantothenate--cysteine ligase